MSDKWIRDVASSKLSEYREACFRLEDERDEARVKVGDLNKELNRLRVGLQYEIETLRYAMDNPPKIWKHPSDIIGNLRKRLESLLTPPTK